MSQTENEIIEILSEMKPGIDFKTQVKLIDDKILTSLILSRSLRNWMTALAFQSVQENCFLRILIL